MVNSFYYSTKTGYYEHYYYVLSDSKEEVHKVIWFTTVLLIIKTVRYLWILEFSLNILIFFIFIFINSRIHTNILN